MIKIMACSLLMLFLGLFTISLGVIKGRVWAADYIDPYKLGNIAEREGITNAFIYTPIILGSLIIVLGLIIFTVVFMNWTKKYL